MKISVEAILAGNYNPKQLAKFRDGRCNAPEEKIEEALTGNYREDMLYTLESAYETYKFFMQQKEQCDLQDTASPGSNDSGRTRA